MCGMLAGGFGVQKSASPPTPPPPSAQQKEKVKTDRFQIEFTCNKCGTRNSHSISRLAYSQGTVIATCPGCKISHIIADNLSWLEDDFVNIKEAMAKRGQPVTDLRVERDGPAQRAAADAIAKEPAAEAPAVAPPSRLPGISEEQAIRIREAVRAGKRRQRQ
jgi:protein import protein ZIM17